MDKEIKKNLIESYQVDGGFIVHNRKMLTEIYKSLNISPDKSTDTRIFELEGITHFFQHGIVDLAHKLSITKDDYILSLGDGSGGPSRLLVKIFGCNIVGIDINPDQVAKAKDLANLHKVEDKAKYFEQNVEDLALEKRDFSKAFCNETTCHWQEKDKAFKAIYEHLKPGALLGFNEWLAGDKGTLNDAYNSRSEFRKLYKKDIWFQKDFNGYRQLLESVGFKILETSDCTDLIDIRMRARLKALKQWDLYEKVMGKEARESGIHYYTEMVETHYSFLKYGVIIAQK